MSATGKTVPVLAAALLGAACILSGAARADPVREAAGCAREFDEAQRVDMESFRDFDEATWLAGHPPQAITIFASGARRQGIESIATMHSHFGRWLSIADPAVARKRKPQPRRVLAPSARVLAPNGRTGPVHFGVGGIGRIPWPGPLL